MFLAQKSEKWRFLFSDKIIRISLGAMVLRNIDGTMKEKKSRSQGELCMNHVVQIEKPYLEDLDGVYQVFETVIRDAFEKEGLGHLEEEITGEILHKKRMLKEAMINQSSVFFLVARWKDQVIGTISFGPCGEIIRECTDGALENIGELGSLFVLPELQNQGVGSKLIHAMIRELHRRGTENFCLDSGYKRAQKRWVRKFGEPYSIVKDYWGEGSDHMIWLCKASDFLRK